MRLSLHLPASASSTLREFSARLNGSFGRRADALFELCNAILTTGTVPSSVYLSLAPVHRRGWGSLYAALSKGTIDAEALRKLLASHDPGAPCPSVYAVDVSSWPRCDAETSPNAATSTMILKRGLPPEYAVVIGLRASATQSEFKGWRGCY